MRCPRLNELPPPPPGQSGWPWTEETLPLASEMPNGRAWPLISIVTPSYNQGHYLEETIRSVLLQGYPDIEYNIIDGGSTDSSVAIIEKYAPWLAYWVSEPDSGQSEAINKGFERTAGAIIAWLNSDDAYFPAVFQQVANAFQEYPDAALIYGKTAQYDDRGVCLSEDGMPFDLRPILVTLRNPIPQPSAFIARSYWLLAGGIRHDLHYLLDHEYWYRLAFLGPIIFVDAVWSKFRLYPQSKTGSNSQRSIKEFETVHVDLVNSPNLPDELAALRPRTLRMLHIKCARNYAWNRQWDNMKEQVWRAYAADWRAALSPQWRRMMVLSLLGPRGANAVVAVKTYMQDKWNLPFPSIG
jgi:glycosyltransferase involved in cell wall biosynthesis